MKSDVEAQKKRPPMLKMLSKPDETAGGRGSDPARKHFLAHRRSLAEHADARRHVQAQHDPDQPELRRLQRLVDVDIAGGDRASWAGPAAT